MKILPDMKPLNLERAREIYFMRLKLESGALPCARCGYKGLGIQLEPGPIDPRQLIPLCDFCRSMIQPDVHDTDEG